MKAASTTLTWDAATGSTGYGVYQSTDGGTFLLLSTVTNPTFSVPVNTNLVTRWYVTGLYPVPPYAAAESPPSNTVTNNPSAPAANITLFAPTLGSTNVAQGSSLNIAAVCRNYGNGDFALTAGSITLLAPGATRSDGPYVYALVIPAQTIAAGASVTFSAVWLAPTNAALGTWTAYLAVQGSGGVWSGGPGTLFTVSTNIPAPLPPLPPTNLRAVQIDLRRWDLQWQASPLASTEVQQSIKAQPFTTIATLPPGTMHVTVQLAKRREYVFQARCFNALGSSPYGNTVSVTPN